MNNKEEVFIPFNAKKAERIFMAISAHQDDIEIMATDGILKAFDSENLGFVAVVTTDGAGSARSGIYEKYTNDKMMEIRKEEQKKAAIIGNYSALHLLNYTSKQVKDNDDEEIVAQYMYLIKKYRPEVIYTHNPADKHDTHVGVITKVLAAIRKLSQDLRPEKLYGCEVWRDLDWVLDDDKVVFDVSGHENLSASLLGVFDSQIAGGKRYDLATSGRRLANATYSASHEVDTIKSIAYALDLSPLMRNNQTLQEYVSIKINNLHNDVMDRLKRIDVNHEKHED